MHRTSIRWYLLKNQQHWLILSFSIPKFSIRLVTSVIIESMATLDLFIVQLVIHFTGAQDSFATNKTKLLFVVVEWSTISAPTAEPISLIYCWLLSKSTEN